MTVRDAKRALRDAVLTARDALTPAARADASRVIAERIAATATFQSARVVLLTLPFRSEWDARLVAREALAAGKVVAAPRVDPSARMLRPLRIRDLDTDVETGYRGVPEPRATCTAVLPEAIDWVLVPGVAFDATGRRLGYGGGYYDRLLPLLPPMAPRVAGAFDLQLCDDAVPASPHDIDVDMIVTESRTLVIHRAGAPSVAS
jgi:5-formyltetrahydrofolate cyclo-ligase